MKLIKTVLVCAVVLCAAAKSSSAQTVQFLGGGSSAMFLELGQAAQSQPATNTPCVWTQGPTANGSIEALDARTNSGSEVQIHNLGNIWVTWSPGSTGTCAAPSGTGINVYSYMSLDSVVGVMCYFGVQAANGDLSGTPGCYQVMTVAAGTSGANLLCNATGPCGYGPDTPIPQGIISSLNNQHYFAAGTDVRPEDARFASTRMFASCGEPLYRQPAEQWAYKTYGLGYGGLGSGLAKYMLEDGVNSYFSSRVEYLQDFEITGNDPIVGLPVPNYSVSSIGAKPIVVVVNTAGGTGIGAATDINGFTLALFLQGVLGRSTDLRGPTTTNPVTALIPEPMSGAYNTMEYSIANSAQFKASQDYLNCTGPVGGKVYSNPLNYPSTNGQIPAFRRRVVGNDEMVSQLTTASTDTLGYFFWSAGNAAKFSATNGKYLTVNGIDPLQNSYTDGVLPGVDSSHPLSNVTFKWLDLGDYPIWSVMRIVSTSPAPPGVTNLVAAAQALNVTEHNFIPMSQLNVWHSHFAIYGLSETLGANGATINPATPGDLCNTPGSLVETGGDAGGANISKQANAHFCADYAAVDGLVDKNN